MENIITQEQALKEIEKNYSNASKVLNDVGKLEKLLNRIEKKLKSIPKIGEKLSHIPVFVSLIRSYIKKEYNEIPLGTLLAIISALIYVVAPVDLIPDIFPGVGHIDDAAVIGACLCLVEDDIKEYINWRDTKA
ncbi:MAG: DUF1232 domain-containing protein [Clostridia bacterium]|nr:DUF1232 domain-containing protein [Clostridia bacterium]MBR2303178.1 DUF1232 domain-containing protein [Clostridia bacterium]